MRRFSAVLAVIVLALSTLTLTSGANVQAVDEFSLWIEDAYMVNAGETVTMTAKVAAGTAEPAAIRGRLTFDDSVLDYVECRTAVAFASCAVTGPGEVLFEAVTSTNWIDEQPLVELDLADGGVTTTASAVGLAVEDALSELSGPLDGAALGATVARLGQGDVNCDGSPSLLDARAIAQYAVGARTDGATCPLADPLTQLILSVADVDDSGTPGLADARLVAQCAIGVVNEFCS